MPRPTKVTSLFTRPMVNPCKLLILEIPPLKKSIKLKDVLTVSSSLKNLLSIKKLCDDNNVWVGFNYDKVQVQDRGSNKLLLEGGLYKLPTMETKNLEVLGVEKASMDLWHHHLGHLNS